MLTAQTGCFVTRVRVYSCSDVKANRISGQSDFDFSSVVSFKEAFKQQGNTSMLTSCGRTSFVNFYDNNIHVFDILN